MIIIRPGKNLFSHHGFHHQFNRNQNYHFIQWYLFICYTVYSTYVWKRKEVTLTPTISLPSSLINLLLAKLLKTLQFHKSLPKLVTFLPLIMGNYWLSTRGSVFKPITAFYDFKTEQRTIYCWNMMSSYNFYSQISKS